MPQLALFLTTVVWGATFPATKAALEQIPPLSFLFLRFLLGMVVVFGVLLLGRRRLAQDSLTLRISLIATGWLFLGYVLQTVGLRFTSASNSAFITVLYVVFVPLYLRRLGLHTWISNGIALAGLWVLVRPTASANLGDLMTLGSAAAFAAHIACLERYTRMVDPVSLFAWQLLFMALAMLGTMWWEAPALSAFEPTRVLVVGLVVTGVLATGAFAVQMWAQRLLPAQQVALLFAAEPAVAAWLAWYFLGETLDAQGWFGSAMILGGVLLGSWTTGESAPRPESAPARSKGG
ncbi:MAG: Permease of the drug/metabolite transporter (DMT) superfamily [Nitrospira sp.]|jgi:drug/metabolite transporter (DMT)-like permease|nr:MAG: Permease of the drug/metabolite transporter (DMT) superfamily [Nitrospira sp.]